MTTPLSRTTPTPNPKPAIDRDVIWEARLFGNFRLIGPDRSNVTPLGRKSRALFAYLLTVGPEGATRDRLAGLLWSERGEDQARASLRQTFYELRRLTSGVAAPIAIDRSRVRVDALRVTTDAQRLDAAARDDEAALAGSLVAEPMPPFLADLDGIDPAFDDWLTIERTRRHDQRRRALLEIAGRRSAAGDFETAERLAEGLLAFDPLDEAAACVAMEAHQRRGDRDAVRRIFARLQDALKKQIGVEVAAETREVHRRLMADPAPHGPDRDAASHANSAHRAVAEVDRATDIAIDEQRDLGTHAGTTRVRKERTPRRAWAFVAAVSFASLVAIIGSVALRPALPPPMRTLLVEPLHAADADAAALALVAGFSADLARLIVGNDTTLRVVDTLSGAHPPPSGGFHVGGEARSAEGKLHATIRMWRDADETILWSRTFERPAGDVEALREEMASKLADVAICAMGRTNPQATAFAADAIRLLLGACDQKQLPDYPEATKLLEQLVALRPDFAHGWALLAVVQQFSASSMPAEGKALQVEAERSAARALAIDPNDADAYYARALGMTDDMTRWQERMDVLARGHALDPTNGRIDNAIGWDLQRVGRWKEAAVFHQRAVRVDPFSTAKTAGLIYVLGWGGEPAGAAAALTDARKRFDHHRVIAYCDFAFNAMIGDARRAQALLDDPARAFVLSPERAALWPVVLAARAEPSPVNEARVERAIERAMRSPDDNAGLVVELLSRRNRVGDAFAFIDRLRPDQKGDLETDILFNALAKSLRDDPRFMTVAARYGLVSIWKQSGRWPDFCDDPTLPYDCRVEAGRAASATPRPLTALR